jgi:hypothetical protein
MGNSQRWVLTVVIAFVAVGIGFGVWFGLLRDIHWFDREVSQEDRHAEIVGASPLPKERVRLVINRRHEGCAVADRAEVDGDKLWVYYHNGCQSTISVGYDNVVDVIYKGIAPDGTVVSSSYEQANWGTPLDPGQKIEFAHTFEDDPRIATMEIILRTH